MEQIKVNRVSPRLVEDEILIQAVCTAKKMGLFGRVSVKYARNWAERHWDEVEKFIPVA